MFHSNNYLFELPQFNDNLKQTSYDLPTTTPNSPGSLKSKYFNQEDSPFNCSFDLGSQEGHSQAIWDASIKYLQTSIKQTVDATKGLNDQLFSNSVNENSILKEESVQQMILSNSYLKIQQKHEFINALLNESQLANLMKELKNLFNQTIFHEMTYAIFKIWQKKSLSTKNNSKQDNEFILQSFDCFLGYQNQQIPKISYSNFQQRKTYEQVIEEATKCSQQIAQQVYFDKKVNLLNLRLCKKETEDQFTVTSLFSQFFKILAQSVYLSSQGFYYQPSNQQEQINQFNQDFEFQINSVSALEELKQNKNRFARSFSQCFEDDDEDFEFTCSFSKKRKLQ